MALHLSFGGEGGFALAVEPCLYQQLTRKRFVLVSRDETRDAVYAPHGWVVVSGAHVVWATTARGAAQPVAVTRRQRDMNTLRAIAVHVGDAHGGAVTYADERKAS